MSAEHPFPSSREGIGSEESGTNYVYISWLDILEASSFMTGPMNALHCQVRTGQNCSVYFLNLENGRYSTKTPASTSWYSVSRPDCTHAGCQVKMVWLSSAIWGKVHNRQHYFACTPAGGWRECWTNARTGPRHCEVEQRQFRKPDTAIFAEVPLVFHQTWETWKALGIQQPGPCGD